MMYKNVKLKVFVLQTNVIIQDNTTLNTTLKHNFKIQLVKQ